MSEVSTPRSAGFSRVASGLRRLLQGLSGGVAGTLNGTRGERHQESIGELTGKSLV